MGLLNLFSGNKNPYVELAQKKVKDVMSKDLLTVEKSKDLTEAAHTMIGSHVSCLVVTSQNWPEGILTERDFIKKFEMEKDTKKTLVVEDMMTKKVVTVDPNLDLFSSHRLMRQNKFRKLVVADKSGIKGIITQTDLCKAVASLKVSVLDGPKVSDIMTKKVVTVSSVDSFKQVKKLMSQKDMGSVVIAEKDEVRGIFTEFDIVSEYFFNPNRLKNSYMKDIMTTPVVCITPDFPVVLANKFMLHRNFRRLPILENGNLVGIVTQTDVTKALYDYLETNKDKPAGKNWKYKEPAWNEIKRSNVILCELKKN